MGAWVEEETRMSLGRQQLSCFVTARPNRPPKAPGLPRHHSASNEYYRMRDRALDSCCAIDDQIIAEREAEVRNAKSTVLKRVTAQPQGSTAALFCAFQAGNSDLSSVHTDSTCIGLRTDGSRK